MTTPPAAMSAEERAAAVVARIGEHRQSPGQLQASKNIIADAIRAAELAARNAAVADAAKLIRERLPYSDRVAAAVEALATS